MSVQGSVVGRGSKPKLKLSDVPRFESVINAIKRALKDLVRGKLNLRDLALIVVLVYTGCRLNEALALTLGDLDFKGRTVKLRQLKKQREFIRIVPVPSKIFWDVLSEYCRTLPFKHSKLFDISDRQARNIVYKFTTKYIGIRIRPHALRHAYATYILKKTKDLEAARRLLGHEDYRVLKAYLDYTQEDLEDPLERLFRELEA